MIMKETASNIASPEEKEKVLAEQLSADKALAKYYIQLLANPAQLALSGEPAENLQFIISRAKNAAKGLLDKEARALLEEEIKKYENLE